MKTFRAVLFLLALALAHAHPACAASAIGNMVGDAALANIAGPANAPAADGGAGDMVMVFGGDVTLDWGYYELAPDPYGDLGWPFRRLRPLFDSADVVMVNLENPITDADTKTGKQFNFRMDPRLVGVLTEAGIGIVTLANNHVFDYGVKGLSDTLSILDANLIRHVGAGMNLDEARQPVVMQIRGRKVGFLGYGNYSEAGPDKPGAAYRHPDHIRRDVRALKSAGVDIVVVNFHWGVEKQESPTERDRSLAYLAVDSGADVVVGHHPHVLQPIERYKGAVIAFSLGNFVFGGNSRRPRDSMLLKVNVAGTGEVTYEALPIRISPEETRYQPYLLGGTGHGGAGITRR